MRALFQFVSKKIIIGVFLSIVLVLSLGLFTLIASRGNLYDKDIALEKVESEIPMLLGGLYSKDENAVYYRGFPIGADVNSFEVIFDWLGKDKEYYYYRQERIIEDSKIDYGTLREVYAGPNSDMPAVLADKNGVYINKLRRNYDFVGDWSPLKLDNVADPLSYEYLGNCEDNSGNRLDFKGYYGDKYYVYIAEYADYASNIPDKSIDRESFEVFDGEDQSVDGGYAFYARDNNKVYKACLPTELDPKDFKPPFNRESGS